MRRLLVTVSVAVVLMAGAGCSDDTPDAAGSGATASATAAPSPSAAGGAASPSGGGAGTAPPAATEPPAGGNARSVCDAAEKSGATAVTAFVRELGAMLRASADGDREAEEQAGRKAEAALDRWSAALREQAGRATDQRLRGALNDLSKEVGETKADIATVDEAQLTALRDRLDQLCGTA